MNEQFNQLFFEFNAYKEISEKRVQTLTAMLQQCLSQYQLVAKQVDDLHKLAFKPIIEQSPEDIEAKFQTEILLKKPRCKS